MWLSEFSLCSLVCEGIFCHCSFWGRGLSGSEGSGKFWGYQIEPIAQFVVLVQGRSRAVPVLMLNSVL